MALNFEIPKLVRELKKRKPKKVLVQLAEGIKQNASEISRVFENLKIEAIFSGESEWGACSIAIQEAEALKCDLLVHFGHAKFINVKFPIVYVEVKDELDLNPLLKKSLSHLNNYKKLGLSYSVQHRHDLKKIKNFFEENGKKILLSKKRGFAAYKGHVIGCEYSGLKEIEKEVDAFIIIGNRFHSLGAVLAVEKPVILLDVYNDEIMNMSGAREKILKQRAISIQKLKDATNVGIIVEIKPGQKFGNSKYLVDKLKEQGKNAIVITMSEITPEKIMNFYHIEAFVELACPRIAVDDFAKYKKPILTFKEALVALGIKTWEDFLKTGIV